MAITWRLVDSKSGATEIYDTETGEVYETCHLRETHPKLTTWREHARAVNAEVRAMLGTAYQPRQARYPGRPLK